MSDAILPKIERVASAENYTRYHIEPLETGFGMTLGNALRRVLLSSLPGAAVTSIKIDGVFHEFSYVPQVKEDTTELILNVKQIRLRSYSDQAVRLFLEASGPGRVVAGDINCPPEVEIINPELHLATLGAEGAKLAIELVVDKGKGYVASDSREGMPIGVIPVDAVFTPIKRVNYSVESTRVGAETDYDRLILDLWTDGTVTPDAALSEAAQILMQHFSLLTGLGGRPVITARKGAPAMVPSKAYDTPIEELGLSVRAYNCLKRAAIAKVGQVLQMSDDDLLMVRNFGQKSLDELKERLAATGFIAEAPPSAVAEGREEEEDEEEEGEERGEALKEEDKKELEEEAGEDEEEAEEAVASVFQTVAPSEIPDGMSIQEAPAAEAEEDAPALGAVPYREEEIEEEEDGDKKRGRRRKVAKTPRRGRKERGDFEPE